MREMPTVGLPTDLTTLSACEIHGILEIYDQPHARATELIILADSYITTQDKDRSAYYAFVGRINATLMSIGITRGMHPQEKERASYE